MERSWGTFLLQCFCLPSLSIGNLQEVLHVNAAEFVRLCFGPDYDLVTNPDETTYQMHLDCITLFSLSCGCQMHTVPATAARSADHWLAKFALPTPEEYLLPRGF